MSKRWRGALVALILFFGIATSITPAQADHIDPTIRAQAHVQAIGWQSWVADPGDGKLFTVGTPGSGLRLEAVRIQGVDIYRAHVQGVGWQGWVEGPNVAGTTGQSLRLEAIQTTGVKCRAYVAGRGWTAWVNPGETCGTTGQSLRLEAIQFQGPLSENPPPTTPPPPPTCVRE